MTTDELITLLDAYRDGRIDDADAARLAAAVRRGDETTAQIQAELEFAGLLMSALDPTDGEAFVRGFQERSQAESQSDTFVRDWQRKLADSQTPSQTSSPTPSSAKPAPEKSPHPTLPPQRSLASSPSLSIMATAASLLLATAAAWLFSSPSASPDAPLARLTEVAGEAVVIGTDGRVTAGSSTELLAGQSLQTHGEESSAVLLYPDGTRLELGAESTVTLFAPGAAGNTPLGNAALGKRVVLTEGFLTADVAKQPPNQPMVLSTPHAELVVLGTRFHLSGGSEVTYVETEEGSVRVTRKSDGESVQVDRGFEASVSNVAGPLTSDRLPGTFRAPRFTLDGFWTAAFSSDGQTLAATSYLEGRVELRDIAAGRIKQTIAAHRRRIHSLAFSHDAATLATGSSDGTIKLWNSSTAQLQATLDPRQGWVSDLVFSADDRMLTVLAGAEGSEERIISLWDLNTHEPRPAPLRVSAKTWAFSSDGKLLAASQFAEKTVTLWDVESGRRQTVLDGKLNNVFSLAFSPDGKTLAVDSASGIIGLWDVATGRMRDKLERRGGRIFGMAFSPDGRVLATGHQDGTVRLANLTTMNQWAVSAASHMAHARALAFTPDGKTLLTREIRLAVGQRPRTGAVQVWDLPPAVELKNPTD